MSAGTSPKSDTGHMVTVAQLREALAACDPDAYVILAKDEEGNDFSPLAITSEPGHVPCAEPGWYMPGTTWYGEFHADADVTDDPDDEDAYVAASDAGELRAVCLWPVN